MSTIRGFSGRQKQNQYGELQRNDPESRDLETILKKEEDLVEFLTRNRIIVVEAKNREGRWRKKEYMIG